MKFQSPWMGRIKGSAGNMTGCKVYDKNVMRAKAFEVSNPNTAAQQTERNFFKEVIEITSSVSEEQLRTIFGMKPKSMSRRNTLTKQVAAAYSVNGTTKSIDFSKLLAIGNGEKVNTMITHSPAGEDTTNVEYSLNDFGSVNSTANIILVIFNQTRKMIALQNTQFGIADEGFEINEGVPAEWIEDNLYVYPTIASNNEYVFGKAWGTFSIKTRATN